MSTSQRKYPLRRSKFSMRNTFQYGTFRYSNVSFTNHQLKLNPYLDLPFLGGLSLHLNHLIAERVSAPNRQFGTLPIGIFLSNLDSGQLETSLMTSYCHF